MSRLINLMDGDLHKHAFDVRKDCNGMFSKSHQDTKKVIKEIGSCKKV